MWRHLGKFVHWLGGRDLALIAIGAITNGLAAGVTDVLL